MIRTIYKHIQLYTTIYKGIQMERGKPDFRAVKIKYDKLEPTELMVSLMKYFNEFDITEIQRQGKTITCIGLSEDRMKKEMEWGKTIGS